MVVARLCCGFGHHVLQWLFWRPDDHHHNWSGAKPIKNQVKEKCERRLSQQSPWYLRKLVGTRGNSSLCHAGVCRWNSVNKIVPPVGASSRASPRHGNKWMGLLVHGLIALSCVRIIDAGNFTEVFVSAQESWLVDLGMVVMHIVRETRNVNTNSYHNSDVPASSRKQRCFSCVPVQGNSLGYH